MFGNSCNLDICVRYQFLKSLTEELPTLPNHSDLSLPAVQQPVLFPTPSDDLIWNSPWWCEGNLGLIQRYFWFRLVHPYSVYFLGYPPSILPHSFSRLLKIKVELQQSSKLPRCRSARRCRPSSWRWTAPELGTASSSVRRRRPEIERRLFTATIGGHWHEISQTGKVLSINYSSCLGRSSNLWTEWLGKVRFVRLLNF